MADNGDKPAAVYVAFATLNNALTQLSQGIPNRIDRSVFPGLSGGVQAQLLSGMRFLGLIDADGKPQPALEKVAVSDEAVRKRELRALLKDRYRSLFELDLTKTTPAELGERMGADYNVTGNTRDKAVRFFLSAADYAEVPVSHLFERKRSQSSARSGGPRRRRKSPRGRPAKKDTEENGGGDSATSKTVSLKSGGELTLSANIDVFALTTEDRKFVFDLIDRMDSYGGEEE